MSTNYLFDNAVIDRYARIANGLEVEPELEFADRLLWLGAFPAGDLHADDVLLDTFLERKAALRVSS
jgi:hypothetical protein